MTTKELPLKLLSEKYENVFSPERLIIWLDQWRQRHHDRVQNAVVASIKDIIVPGLK